MASEIRRPIADWQLPPGVSRGVWDYVHDADLARNYDHSLSDSPLLQFDIAFALKTIPPGSRVLDLGCGTGRIAMALAQRGDRVTAVDLSPEMLRIVEEKSKAAGVAIERLERNIVELDDLALASFDAAICMFSTLGMIAGPTARACVLQNMQRCLKPGGTAIVHVHNRWHQLRSGIGRRWLFADVVRSLLGKETAGDFVMPHSAEGNPSWTMHLFNRHEARRLFERAGLQVTHIEPVGLSETGRLHHPRFMPSLRAYGFLLVGKKPGESVQ